MSIETANKAAEYTNRVGANSIARGIVAVAAAGTTVLDVRGCIGFTAIFAVGTPTATPCTSTGGAVTGAVAAALTSGVLVSVAWPYYLITATGGALSVAAV